MYLQGLPWGGDRAKKNKKGKYIPTRPSRIIHLVKDPPPTGQLRLSPLHLCTLLSVVKADGIYERKNLALSSLS